MSTPVITQAQVQHGSSASEALSAWRRRNNENVSADLLFGLTRSAWYALEVDATGARFLTTHPAALERGFVALNVPMETFHWWGSELTADTRYLLGEGAMVEVPKNAAGTHGGYRFLGAAEYLWLEGPEREQDPDHALETLAGTYITKCGRPADLPRSEGPATRCSFYVPYVKSAVWDRKGTLRLALQQQMQQMIQTSNRRGAVGLAALTKLAEMLVSEEHGERCRQLLLPAGHCNEGCGRNRMASFLCKAAEELGAVTLTRAAGLFNEVASLWEELHALALVLQPRDAAKYVLTIQARETEALKMLTEAA